MVYFERDNYERSGVLRPKEVYKIKDEVDLIGKASELIINIRVI